MQAWTSTARRVDPTELFITGTLHDYHYAGRLGHLRVPTLFTCGRHDEATPAATATYRDLVQGAELHVFEGSSHTPHLEETSAYVAVVCGFPARHDAASAT